MKRRIFTGAVLAAAGLVLTGVRATVYGTHDRAAGTVDDERLKHLITRALSDRDSALAVGRKYMSQYPQAADGAPVRVRIEIGRAGQLTADSFREYLQRQRQTDFARGDSIIIDGWVLARCEVDLCAVLATLS